MHDTWTAIDFETANRNQGSVCAVGLVRVTDGRIVDRYTTLVRPPAPVDHFEQDNIAVHGITPEHVADAPLGRRSTRPSWNSPRAARSSRTTQCSTWA